MSNIEASKKDLIDSLKERVEDGIIEQANADLLIKLIEKADSLTEAINIAELGTTYKRTGFHFDKRLEKMGDTIKYLKRNNELSFSDGTDAPHHKLIIGDNYDALQNLLVEYRGTVDVIYIDPPYGKDDMGEFAHTNYDNAITRDNLLSLLYPRLFIARQLLSDYGVIFCSIDDKNEAYVKGLMDDIFQEKNFIQDVIWNSRKSVSNDAIISLSHNHTLVYVKNATSFNEVKKGFKLAETGSGFANPDNDPRGPWKADPFDAPEVRENLSYPITNPNTGEVFLPPEGRHWSKEESTYKALLADNRIIFGRTGRAKPQVKRFLKESKAKGLTPKSIWDDCGTTTDGTNELEKIMGAKVFKNPKPTAFIKRCAQLGGGDTSIILDFFAGSGTTGQAVIELNKEDNGNRTFILCTNNEVTDINPNGIALDVTTKRLKRVMTGSCFDGTSDFKWAEDNEPLGGSLDVYDIATVANFEQGEGRTPFDVIDETAYGLPTFEKPEDKIRWVCENFDNTQKYLEDE